MKQEGLNSGILVTWTKSFANTDGVGADAVQLLEEALQQAGVSIQLPCSDTYVRQCKRKRVCLQVTNVKVMAILNDTSGCLMAGSYLDKECKIGVIMGE